MQYLHYLYLSHMFLLNNGIIDMIITAVRKKILIWLDTFWRLTHRQLCRPKQAVQDSTALQPNSLYCTCAFANFRWVFLFHQSFEWGWVNANRNATCSPSLACKNKTEKDCNCSRIAKETVMMKSSLQTKSQHSFLEVTFYIHME